MSGTTTNNTTLGMKVASASVVRVNRFVKVGDNAMVVEQDTAAASDSFGVATIGSPSGSTISIPINVLNPGAKILVECGAAIDPATKKGITTDAQGRAVVAQANQAIYGYAVSETENAGELVTLLVNRE